MMDSLENPLYWEQLFYNSSNYTGNFSLASLPEDWFIDMNMLDATPFQYQISLILYYLNGIFGIIIAILGIIGNILSVIVLSQRVMRSSTYSYLSALALSDTFFLTFTVFLLVKDTDKPENGMITHSKPYTYFKMFPIIHAAAVTFQVTSIWLTLAFTVDRYIMICHPFKAERWCSISRARKVIIFLFILGVIYNLPRFFEYEVVIENITLMNVTLPTRYFNKLTPLGESKIFREINHSWLYLICVVGLPFLSLSVLNIFLIIAVHKSRKKGLQLNAKEKRRNNTTVMLIGVIIIFLCCQGPALVSRMVWAIDIDAFKSLSWAIFNEVSNFFVILNSAVNILPYYFFGKKFRRQFWRLFCSCLLSKEEIRRIARSLSLTMDRRNSNISQVPPQELQTVVHHENYNSIKQYKNSISMPLIEQRPSLNENVLPNTYSQTQSLSSYSSGEPPFTDESKVIDQEKPKVQVNLDSNGHCGLHLDYTVTLQQCATSGKTERN